jgi:hypothetical protein
MPRTFTPSPARRIPDEERELPVVLTPNNEPVRLGLAVTQPGNRRRAKDAFQLSDPEYDRRLAIARIRAQKDFRMGLLGADSEDSVITQDRAIQEIEQGTEIGKQLVRMEIFTAKRYFEAATGAYRDDAPAEVVRPRRSAGLRKG